MIDRASTGDWVLASLMVGLLTGVTIVFGRGLRQEELPLAVGRPATTEQAHDSPPS